MDVFVDIARGLLDLSDGLVLLLDQRRHLAEHLGELGHGLLNLLQLGVTLLYLAVSAAGGTIAVGVEKRLREDLGVTAVDNLLNLGFGSVGLDNLELTRRAVPSLLAVVPLDLLVVVESTGETCLGSVRLRLCVLVSLDVLEEALDGRLGLLTELLGIVAELVGVRNSVLVGRVLRVSVGVSEG